MRKSEVMDLEWERVDFARGVILLERTKTGKRRELSMNRAVYDVLSAISRPDDGAGPVFRNATGEAWRSIRTAFEQACRDAKVLDFRFHDLRHTFASWLVMRGRPLKEVQELLGHKTITMTMRYAHLAPDRLRDAVAALEDFSTSSTHGSVVDALTLVNTRQN
jgi:integrase